MTLAELEIKYFDASNYDQAAPETADPPIYRYATNDDVEFLMEGEKYFPAVHQAISATTGASDAVYLVGWQFTPEMELMTGESEPVSPNCIGKLLAAKCAAKVDVRVVLNGTLVLHSAPSLPFVRNLKACELLRSLTPPAESTPPLANVVLFDWSGANQTGTQHQKAVVIRRGTEVTAFVAGGLDMVPKAFDNGRHETPKNEFSLGSNTYWGFHDFGMRLHGDAANRVLNNFRSRWEEARTLPNKTWKKHPGDETESRQSFNPQPIPETPSAVPSATTQTVVSPSRSVQILRSRFKWKIPDRCGLGGVMWAGLPGDPATGGLYEIYYTMKKAIGAARKYIYIEDQYLDDQPHLDGVKDPSYSLFPELLKALNATANFDLRLIFVGSGHKDPGDPGPALKNQSLTSSIQKVVDGLLPLRKTNVAVWRRDLKTVHSKVMIIDDEFVSLGSANFQSRSMAGIDSELQAAVVAQDDLVKDLRILLWAEHFKLNPSMSGVGAGLNSIDSALALWRKDWYSDTAYWDNLTGHNPAAGYGGLISFVGPGVVP